MSRDARVSDALLRLHKTAQTAVLPQRVKAVAPTGQDLVDIALMTYIVDDAVARGVELALECNSQLYNAQIGRQMTAVSADLFNEKRPDFRCELTARRVCRTTVRANRQDCLYCLKFRIVFASSISPPLERQFICIYIVTFGYPA